MSSVIPFNKKALPDLPVSKSNKYALPQSPEIECWIAVGAGALYSGKQAPAEQFSDILNGIGAISKFALGVIFLGDEYDKEQSEKVISGLKDFQEILNYCGEVSLIESAQILSMCCCALQRFCYGAHGRSCSC